MIYSQTLESNEINLYIKPGLSCLLQCRCQYFELSITAVISMTMIEAEVRAPRASATHY
jgi:hypothetical protein